MLLRVCAQLAGLGNALNYPAPTVVAYTTAGVALLVPPPSAHAVILYGELIALHIKYACLTACIYTIAVQDYTVSYMGM